jgi:L-lactate dehydrogenase complex protein LldF
VADVKTAQFDHASARAIRDEPLQRLLHRVVDQQAVARDQAVEGLTQPLWEQLRERARSVKAEAISHLDFYLDLLERSVRRNGGHVHFARTAAEANEQVWQIAQRHQVKRVVKAKSMVSEELGLTSFLEKKGIETVETDLGEYIIQLAGEPPFHMTAPALHKSRQEVSDLFQRHLNSKPTTDIGELSRIARDTLRQKFAAADMGITGANFLVAETGDVVLVTNEGNGRMTTSLPRVQVVVAGMEKVLPAIEDVALFLRLLARSATGQTITTYTTFFGGPKSLGDEDGPEEFHLVLVDNGRTKLLEDPELRESLYCIRCGACSNICPVYRNVGGHAYGWVYSGPIGAVITPVMTGLKQAKALPFASTLCGACRDVCPVKIDLPRMLLTLRRKAVEGDPKTERSSTWMERLLMRCWSRALKTRQAMERSLRRARWLQKPWARHGKVGRIPIPVLSRWSRGRDFPAVASSSFHQVWKERLAESEQIRR